MTNIPCKETSGCNWECSHQETPCGWGDVTCVDEEGNPGFACDTKADRQTGFIQRSEMEMQCFKPCPAGQGLSSLCAVTSNHLDEQYGSLNTLVEKTCQSDGHGKKVSDQEQHPDVIVLLTQELNHASYINIGGINNDFPDYVQEDSLAGYTMAATCVGDLSANTAVFVKRSKSHQIYLADMECTGTSLVSAPCDYTNCKGSTVMGLTTTAGKLVVGNWHGQRAGTLSKKRVEEFENAARAVLAVQPFKGKKYVVFGGDTNVRSDFGPKVSSGQFIPEGFDLAEFHTPAEIVSVVGPDVLGIEGATVDQHLSGQAGLDEAVKAGLRETPLKQVKGWDTMCPGKTKSTDSARYVDKEVWTGKMEDNWGWVPGQHKVMKTVQESFHNLKCRSPPDQMSTGDSPDEFIDMKKYYGDKSSSPSWTERFFLDETLYQTCGKAMKDVRNAQTDHDALYVNCQLPELLTGEA